MPHFNKPQLEIAETYCGDKSATDDICEVCDRAVRDLSRKHFNLKPMTDEEWARISHQLKTRRRSKTLIVSGAFGEIATAVGG